MVTATQRLIGKLKLLMWVKIEWQFANSISFIQFPASHNEGPLEIRMSTNS